MPQSAEVLDNPSVPASATLRTGNPVSVRDIKRIYNDWKDKPLNLNEMIKMYSINTDGLIYYRCYIDFRRGGDFEQDGIITESEYTEIRKLLDNGEPVPLGEVNGKHSNVDAYSDDIRFSDDPSVVERYIIQNPHYGKDYDNFWDCLLQRGDYSA